ncbi:MAG: hypothetical protein WCO18_01770, partial [bacterium]
DKYCIVKFEGEVVLLKSITCFQPSGGLILKSLATGFLYDVDILFFEDVQKYINKIMKIKNIPNKV